MKVFSSVLFSLLSISILAQGPVITPLKGNARLKDYNGQVSEKRSITDTVHLPFFDDFTSTNVYPDMRIWADSQVYINSHFPISPPSYGVATFDNLNKKGAPYRLLSGNTSGASDSLTTNLINLKSYKSGINTFLYSIADSIYLSFFYQTQGIGDPLDATDSLVLKFKDTGGDWHTVWKAKGSAVKPFQQILVSIANTRFLSAGFQFRFINFGKNTGNMNQWHLDYVRMKSGRNRLDTLIQDVAINRVPVGPLKVYETMPYDHFIAAQIPNKLSYHEVTLRNNFNSSINVQYNCDVRDQNNTLINSYPLSARNIDPQSDSFEQFAPFTMTGLTGKEPIVRIKYTLVPGTNDFLPATYNSLSDNNVYTKSVFFKNYYAYDDGSAEGGYGLDYGSLPAGPGYSALKFDLFKSDTLRGISIFFNRSVSDITFKPFTVMIWKNISEPPANNTKNDVILKRIAFVTTSYSDSINGFISINLDTALILPAGNLYIGWEQTSNFILNVGYDNNYKYQHIGGKNPNLFYNLNGYWEKANSAITGVPMIRPVFGGKLNDPAGISEKESYNKVFIFPNPSSQSSMLMLDSDRDIQSVEVYDITGKLCLRQMGENLREINVTGLPAGFYQVMVSDANHQVSIHKYIIN